MSGDLPQLYSIPPGEPFLDVLAARLLEEAGGDPLALTSTTVLLPTRRACRALGEAFLRVADGRPLVLPAMRPIGDVDETALALGDAPGFDDLDLPPAIAPLQRELALTELVLAWSRHFGEAAPEHAALLARELARLLDQLQTERIPFDRLEQLAPDEHADHWRATLAFLEILRTHWPAYLEERSCLDPADRRNRLLEAQAAAWTAAPPADPVIAAGSTGSIPATRALLKVVAGLPRGRVVLPGLDRHLDGEAWHAVAEEPTHPQHGLARLLSHLGADREDVQDWPLSLRDGAAREARSRLASEVMRPAATTETWRTRPTPERHALAGISRAIFPTQVEEAAAIALMMRASLEDPADGRTVALVTADRSLARRVAAELERWDITVDDSAGRPLMDTPPATFLRHCLAAAAGGLAPVALLSLLKHPLAGGGQEPADFRRMARRLEHAALRGSRPAAGIAGLKAAVRAAGTGRHPVDGGTVEELLVFLAEFSDAMATLLTAFAADAVALPDLVDRLVAAVEALATTRTESGADRLWAGDAGEALAAFLVDLREHGSGMPPIAAGELPGFVDALLAGQVVRPRVGAHPRLHIWGVLEARLQHADLTILGGLNEASWPPEPSADPWMSRPMRQKLELPSPERQIGLSAHDFMLGLCGERVVLTRAEKVGGQPTVPARWLSRLNAVLRLKEGDPCPDLDDVRWAAMVSAMNRAKVSQAIAPPAPRPPAEVRPERLSVTRVETWMRDPYSIYAQQILKLEALEPLEADPGAAERGTFVHEALDVFLKAFPDDLPDDALDRLLAFGAQAFGDALAQPVVRAFWWPRFERVAAWFLDLQRQRREDMQQVFTEVPGELAIALPHGAFTLTAKADRIDRMRDGGFAVIDYKTGVAPSKREVEAGFAPQLPLEAAMVHAGAWKQHAIEGPVASLEYWRLTGGDPAGAVETRGEDEHPWALAEAALQGLEALAARFQDPETPYLSVPRPKWSPRYNDFEHLARVREWSTGGEEQE